MESTSATGGTVAERTRVALFEAEYGRYRNMGRGAIEQLESRELVSRSGSGNSAATIVWHVAGNLESRFTDFLTSDGEKPWRDREGEFEAREAGRDEALARWEQGWTVLFDALAGLSDDDLTRTVTIRGVPHRVDEALLRSLAHAALHVGQIVHIGKTLLGDRWRWLTIPPGGTAEYNRNPGMEKGPGR